VLVRLRSPVEAFVIFFLPFPPFSFTCFFFFPFFEHGGEGGGAPADDAHTQQRSFFGNFLFDEF
jgi:hypothetical protein